MASSSKEAAPIPRGRRESKELPSIRCLGKGLSGIIYETTWLGNRYARKDFPLGSVKHNDVFEKEAKSLLELDHPNIVKCYGYTTGMSSCSLLQEYVDNNLQNTREKKIEDQRKKAAGSNTTFQSSRVLPAEKIKPLFPSMVQEAHVSSNTLENTRLFGLPMAVDIIFQIATGMEYLHDHGISHGDLKPSNVLLQWESGVLKVKVRQYSFSYCELSFLIEPKRIFVLSVQLKVLPSRYI